MVTLDLLLKSHAMPQEYKVNTVKSPEVVSGNDLDELVDNLLLTRYAPASVVVDQDMEIIQFRGSTTLFLQHGTGKASLNLTKMAHPSLVFELRNMVYKARKTGQPARKDLLEIIRNGKPSYVNIEAVPITNPASQQLFLVLFEEISVDQFEKEHPSDDSDQRSQMLEAELAAMQVKNDQLTESYAYSEAILSTISEATLMLDEDLRVKSANKAFYKTFSTSAELIEERLIYELGSRQLDVAALRDVLHNVTARGISVQGYEVQINISPDEKRTMVIHARKVVQHGKQIVLLVFEDITAYRREQALFQQRQQWFEELVDNAPAMIWVCQTDGKINFLNKAWTDYTGLSNENGEITFLGSIHPSDIKSYQSEFAKQFAQQKPFTCEYRLKRADGEYRWVLENARPIFTAEGVFIGYTGSSMDIQIHKTLTQQLNRHVDEKTLELKQANAQLTQTAENLQAVLDSSPAAIGFFKVIGSKEDEATLDFEMAVCNKRFSTQYGSPVGELIGALASQLLGVQRLLNMKQVYQSGKPIYHEHYDELTQHWCGRSISRHDHGIAITEIDITALKAAHVQENELITQLNNSYQMIESLSVMKEYVQHRGAFLRTTFHDLRGSFGLVVGAASLLDIIETQEERDKVLGIIQRNLTQVANMMNQLLDYSRLESGEETLQIDTFDATVLLVELCEGAARTAQEKGLTLAFTGPDKIMVDSDPIKVRRITQNLILNAVKYTNEGNVNIKWQLINDQENDLPQWKLTISDTGPGLPHHLLQKLDPQHHAGTAPEVDAEAQLTHTEGHGEGIGLFIVKRLCELIGGQMKVESDSSTGTRFHLTFPLHCNRTFF